MLYVCVAGCSSLLHDDDVTEGGCIELWPINYQNENERKILKNDLKGENPSPRRYIKHPFILRSFDVPYQYRVSHVVLL